MANFVKSKIGVSIACVGVLALIPLLRNNFNAPPSFTRWGNPITWKDFAGVPRYFSRYDAGISSTIYLAYDSTLRQYYAYAAQDNNYSWARPDLQDSTDAYLLNHEQYHFNITEIHARMLNNYIRMHPEHKAEDYERKLLRLQEELYYMQDDYDNESGHSINRAEQRWWEYRIDSLLQVHAGDSGRVTDYYSGAQAFFPIKPKQGGGINSHKIPYQYAVLNRYDMTLMVLVFQQAAYRYDMASIQNYAIETYTNLKLPIRSISVEPVPQSDDFMLAVIAEDTAAQTVLHDLWTAQSSYLYRVSAEIHRPSADSTAYYRIAKSFTNSFRVINTNTYWTEKLDRDSIKMVIQNVETVRKDESPPKVCYTVLQSEVHGFYRGPIRHNDRLIIAYDVVDQPDSLIRQHGIYVNDKLITFTDYSANVLYVVPEENQPKNPYALAIGYFLQNHSLRGCPAMHNQKITVE